MTNDHRAHTVELTLEETDAELARFSARDRELTKQLADIYAGGPSQPSPELTEERKQAARHRARALSPVIGALLPPLVGGAVELQLRPRGLANASASSLPAIGAKGPSEAELFIEQDEVRLILTMLRKVRAELQAMEDEKWGRAHAADFLALVREYALAGARLAALDERIHKFIRGAGDARFALPLVGPAERVAREIDLVLRPIEDFVSAALDGGAVTSGDLKKARQARAAA